MNNFDVGEMDTPIVFYELSDASQNGLPGRPQETEYYTTFAKQESVSIKDYQTAIMNNTQHEVTFFIRDFPINNKMIIKRYGDDTRYRIKSYQPNYKNSHITVIRTEATSQ